jgi:hypothetical protein
MCLKNEKPSTAKPEVEVFGYVIMCHIIDTGLFISRHDVREVYQYRLLEPRYKLDKWYKARYFPNARMSYMECNRKNPPGFHAYHFLKGADDHHRRPFGKLDHQVVVKARFKGVIMNGLYAGDPCFRAMYRKLIGVVMKPDGTLDYNAEDWMNARGVR